jgi:hypothetical protein
MGGGYLDGPVLEDFTGGAALGYDLGVVAEACRQRELLSGRESEGR